MTAGFDAMVFIPYTPGPLSAPDYEAWLRAVDNPFFNSRPGIAEYSNWKVVDQTGPVPFTHFDFLGLEAVALAEQVWFDGPLDEFRQGWVAKWGYGGTPNPAARFAYLLETPRGPRAATTMHVAVAGWNEGNPVAGAEHWTVTALLRKHWAVGLAPAGESWRLPPDGPNPLGLRGLSVAPVEDAARWRDGLLRSGKQPAFAFCAACLASPTRPPA